MTLRAAKAIFGSESAAKVMLFLDRAESGYCLEIARHFRITQRMVQIQLDKFEGERLLLSQVRGRTRIYAWNPSNALIPVLRSLLSSLWERMTPVESNRLMPVARRRPRRRGKPA